MTRPPGEGRARAVVTEGGAWAGKPPYDTVENWVAHIARLSTPVREFGPDGEFLPWISPTPRSAGDHELAGGLGGPLRSRHARQPSETPDGGPPRGSASPSSSVTPAGAG